MTSTHDELVAVAHAHAAAEAERVYGSERLLRLMLGPVYEECSPIEVGEPG